MIGGSAMVAINNLNVAHQATVASQGASAGCDPITFFIFFILGAVMVHMLLKKR